MTDMLIPEVPPGPLTPSFRTMIESSVAEMVPQGKKGAVLGVATLEGVKVVVATRINDQWSLVGDVEKQWGGDVSGQIGVMFTW